MGASNKPTEVDETTATPLEEAAPARRARKGDILHVTVEPESNNGHDTAPLLVTSVDGDGLVHGLVFRESTAAPQLVGGLHVFGSRDEIDALDRHEDPKVRATRPGYAAHHA